MGDDTLTDQIAHCAKCGFEAPAGGSEWGSVSHPPLGTMTTCPECGSTQVHNMG